MILLRATMVIEGYISFSSGDTGWTEVEVREKKAPPMANRDMDLVQDGSHRGV